MSAAPASDRRRQSGAWAAFLRFEGSRPLWGGLLVTLAGVEILVAVKAPLPIVLKVGMQGLAGYLIPVVILLCGLLLIGNPEQRVFYSVVAAVLTLASWATSNLGGFVIGLVLGLVGSALAFAWTPRKVRRPPAPAATPDPHRVAQLHTILDGPDDAGSPTDEDNPTPHRPTADSADRPARPSSNRE